MSRGTVFGERLLRAAMRFHPRLFRQAYEREMVEYYRAVVVDCSTRGALWRVWFVWKCVGSALFRGVQQRFRDRGSVGASVGEVAPASGTQRTSLAHHRTGWARGLGERGTESMTTWLQEIRQAGRALVKRPGFAAVVALTLALGIGANTAVFSVLHAVLLAPLPYEDAEQLVRVYETRSDDPSYRNYMRAPAMRDLRETLTTTQSFAAIYNYQQETADLTDGDRPERVTVLPVSEGYFEVVGASPWIGRTFRRDEEHANARVAIVSHRVFETCIGEELPCTLTVDGTAYTVVGVMPDGYQDPLQGRIDVFVPIPDLLDESWENHYLTTIARLRPGATVDQLGAELDAAAARHREFVSGEAELAYVPVPLREDLVGSADTTLWLLMGAVVLVFLIACVNVASVSLARGAAREKELAVRVALGSRRSRLMRQLLTESGLLGVLGAVVGLGLGAGVVRALVRLAPEGLPGIGDTTLNGPVFLFGFVATVAAVLLFGLLPALAASRTSAERALRQGGRSGGEGSLGRSRSRSTLVVAEVSLALVLFVGAGILVRSFQRLAAVDLVVDAQNVAVFQVSTPEGRYDAAGRDRFHREYLARLSALPGVEAVGAVSWLPVGGSYHDWGTWRADGDGADPDDMVITNQRVVEGDYFRAVGIRLLRGRPFGPQDRPDAPMRVAVNRSFAESLFPGDTDPVGRAVVIAAEPREIIGVVEDVPTTPRGQIQPIAYHLHRQFADNRNWSLRYTVKLEASDPGFLSRAGEALAAIDPNLVLYQPRLLSNVLARQLAAERFAMMLLSAFAGVALLLTAVGIYGILAQSVNQRRHEIGVRVALGARRRDVQAMIVRQGLALAAGGIVVGITGALLGAQLLSSMVFEVSVRDPVVFAVVPFGVLIVALAASWIPAARATRVDPAEAFRTE